MMVVAVISVDTYPFLVFLDLTCGYRKMIQEQMFSGCTVPPDIKETELGGSNQEVSLSSGKIPGQFYAMQCMEVCPRAISSGVDISVVWVLFVATDQFSLRVKNLLQGLVFHKLTAYLSVSIPFYFSFCLPYSMNYGHTGIFPSTFVPPVPGIKNSILDSVLKLNPVKRKKINVET